MTSQETQKAILHLACRQFQQWAGDTQPGGIPDLPVAQEEAARAAFAWAKRGEATHFGQNDFLAAILPNLAKEAQGRQPAWHPPALVTDRENLMPQNEKQGAGFNAQDKLELWRKFRNAIQAENALNDIVKLQNLLSIFAHNVPAPDAPSDISLYALVQVAVAFAQAQAQGQERGLCLLGGELSGIQDFLYEVSIRMAAKLLKGRSFYVSLLCESIRLFIQDELGLSPNQCLIDAGGKFLILAGHQDAAKMEALRSRIESRLWAAHGSSLRFHFAATNFEENAGFQAVLQLWQAQIMRRRQQPFGSLLATGLSAFFQPSEPVPNAQSGQFQRCALTGEELPADATSENDEGEPIYISEMAKRQVDLGKQLKGSSAVATYNLGKASKQAIEVAGLGYAHRFLRHAPDIKEAIQNSDHFHRFNPKSWEEALSGYAWYGGASYPEDPQSRNPLDFDHIAKAEGEDGEEGEGKGLKRLGYLRMDVDDLGSGIQSIKSWARYVGTSRALDRFFKGHLEALRNQEPFKGRVVLVYAGGDDIFAVGRWLECLQFAQAVRKDFQAYCGGNARPSLSGGIVLLPSKFPVSKAAKLAGDAEDQAKAHSAKDGQGQSQPKDSLSLFSQAFHWQSEWSEVMALKVKLLEFVTAGIFNKSLLQKLQAYFEDETASTSGPPNADGFAKPWSQVWDLARYKETLEKRKDKTQQEVAALRMLGDLLLQLYNLRTGNETAIRIIRASGIAARLVELELRTKDFDSTTEKLQDDE